VQRCWMSLTSDGNRVVSRTLQAGESPIFDAKEQFVMVLGNAGGVRLKINGKPAKPLGAPGAVVKLLIDMQTIPDLLQKLAG
jgi:cytoskeleton protein RodZ